MKLRRDARKLREGRSLRLCSGPPEASLGQTAAALMRKAGPLALDGWQASPPSYRGRELLLPMGTRSAPRSRQVAPQLSAALGGVRRLRFPRWLLPSRLSACLADSSLRRPRAPPPSRRRPTVCSLPMAGEERRPPKLAGRAYREVSRAPSRASSESRPH